MDHGAEYPVRQVERRGGMRPKIADVAKGKWPNILPALGVDKRFLTNRHGPCPMCEGKDRFRFDDKEGKGTWFCRQCGAGDGVTLAMKINGWDFKEAARKINELAGSADRVAIRNGPDPGKVKADMLAFWKSSAPMGAVPAVDAWWRRRVGSLPPLIHVRGHQALQLWDHGANLGHHPAMLAKIHDAEGRWVNLHRTFLKADGRKSDLTEPRRVMAVTIPPGSAIRLFEPGEVMGVAEGLETAVAASLLHGVPVWATINSTGLKSWLPPTGVRKVLIFGDNDAKAGGQAAAWALAHRLLCRKEPVEAEVLIPDRVGWDWNDVHAAQRVAA